MRNLFECGINPIEIIRGATLYPAQWLGIDNKNGSIDIGKEANILILNGNPIEDINNIDSIYMVIKNGRISKYDRDGLDLTRA
jgi:imidazolonepropionase-like amidohydrolase